MKSTLRASTTGLGVLAVLGGLLVATAGPAAATTPPYETASEKATYQLGQINFYDAAGNRVTSGSTTDDPFSKYVVATSNDPQASNTTATLYAYTPVKDQSSALWSGEALTGPTTFPVAGAPAPVGTAGTHRPVVTVDTEAHGVLTLADYIADFPNGNAGGSGWEGLYQLRLRTTGNDPKYWAADISVTGTTWTQVYPSGTPAPTVSAAISGIVRVSSTVTCTKSNVTNASIFAYKWFHNGTQISSQTKSTYKISEAYYKQTLTCKITATGPGGSKTATSSGKTVAIGPALKNVSSPYLYRKTSSGVNKTSAKRGVAEHCNHGTWSPAATSYRYQWYRGTTKISGATSSSYTPTKADVGKTISCLVTAKRTGWTSGKKKTAGVKVVS